MYTVFDKDMIEMEIMSIIPRTKGGFRTTVPVAEIVNAILYKLKTGVHMEPATGKSTFFRDRSELAIGLQHSQKWCLSGTWKEC